MMLTWALITVAVTATPYALLNTTDEAYRGTLTIGLLLAIPLWRNIYSGQLVPRHKRGLRAVLQFFPFVVLPPLYTFGRMCEVLLSPDPCAKAVAGAEALRQTPGAVGVARLINGMSFGVLGLPLPLRIINIIVQNILILATGPTCVWFLCGDLQWMKEVTYTTIERVISEKVRRCHSQPTVFEQIEVPGPPFDLVTNLADTKDFKHFDPTPQKIEGFFVKNHMAVQDDDIFKDFDILCNELQSCLKMGDV